MKLLLLVTLVIGLGGLTMVEANAGAAERTAVADQSYDDLFPSFDNYQRTVQAAVVGKGDPPTNYRQTAVYEWLGGRLEAIEITLTRDPEFKEKYAAATIKKDAKAKEVKVGKRTGWLWKNAVGDADQRLVVPMAADKALILVGKDMVQSLKAMAEKLDLDQADQRLDGPPNGKQ